MRFLTEIALMALPMTFIIITGGIDSRWVLYLAFSSIVLGFSWQSLGLPLPLAICAGVAAGTLAGLINGLLIVGLRVPAANCHAGDSGDLPGPFFRNQRIAFGSRVSGLVRLLRQRRNFWITRPALPARRGGSHHGSRLGANPVRTNALRHRQQ